MYIKQSYASLWFPANSLTTHQIIYYLNHSSGHLINTFSKKYCWKVHLCNQNKHILHRAAVITIIIITRTVFGKVDQETIWTESVISCIEKEKKSAQNIHVWLKIVYNIIHSVNQTIRKMYFLFKDDKQAIKPISYYIRGHRYDGSIWDYGYLTQGKCKLKVTWKACSLQTRHARLWMVYSVHAKLYCENTSWMLWAS